MPGEVKLKPAQTMAGARWVGVMVVVPTLTEGEQRYPPAVPRQIRAVEVAVAEGVGGGINQPSDVIDDHQTQGDGPKHQADSTTMHLSGFTDPVQTKPQGDLQQQEPAVQPAIERVYLEITGVAIEFLQRRNVMQHPLAVAPPQTAAGIVVIDRLIGKAVVMAV